jgi:hypothetical protein
MLSQFFSFIETEFAEDELIGGSQYRSPLNKDFDSPRSKRYSKTNKEIIPAGIYGYLIFYCYAIEEFGMHLEKMVKQGELPIDSYTISRVKTIDSTQFGFTPIVKYRGKEYPIRYIPNVFAWAKRELAVQNGDIETNLRIPHCTSLRLVTTSAETGLRAQSVQWLDKRTWDSLNTNSEDDQYVYSLFPESVSSQ